MQKSLKRRVQHLKCLSKPVRLLNLCHSELTAEKIQPMTADFRKSGWQANLEGKKIGG